MTILLYVINNKWAWLDLYQVPNLKPNDTMKKNRFKYVISPCTFIQFWYWFLHFFLFGINPCTL